MGKPKAWEKHRQRVLKKYPTARECIAWPDDKIYIVVGLNSIIGQGRYGSIAWANASMKMTSSQSKGNRDG